MSQQRQRSVFLTRHEAGDYYYGILPTNKAASKDAASPECRCLYEQGLVVLTEKNGMAFVDEVKGDCT
jgi:hypothetical protein